MGSAIDRVDYFDSSALVKRYLLEAGSNWVQARYHDATCFIAIADVGRVEIAAAFAGKLRGGLISPVEYQAVRMMLDTDVHRRYYIIPVEKQRIDEAIVLTGRRKLRGYDAVHLACALYLNQTLLDNRLPPLVFVTADEDLLQAAQSEGLSTENPNLFP